MEAGFALVLVVGADPVHGPNQRCPECRIDPCQGPLPGAGVERPVGGRQVHAIVPSGVLPDGLIAPGEHIVQDGAHAVPGGRIAAGTAGKEGVERLERRHGQHANHPEPSR